MVRERSEAATVTSATAKPDPAYTVLGCRLECVGYVAAFDRRVGGSPEWRIALIGFGGYASGLPGSSRGINRHMTCSRCGAAAPPNARFCPECGNALQASCRNCGSPLIAGAKFCAECGTPTGVADANGATRGPTAATLTATNGPVAERRLVSILFADLVGFTTADAPVVQANAADARAIFERLGARPFSAKLEELLGEGSPTPRPAASSVADHEAETTTARGLP
jgi:predicted nucleic acid-binding Zn ribbon protein